MDKNEDGVLQTWKKKTDAYGDTSDIEKTIDAVCGIYLKSESTDIFDIIEGQPGHPEIQRGWNDGRRTARNFVESMEGPIRFYPLKPTVHVSGDLAVAYSVWKLECAPKNGSRKIDAKVRMTTLFEWIDGEWIITHDHISVPQKRDEAKWMFGAKFLDEPENA